MYTHTLFLFYAILYIRCIVLTMDESKRSEFVEKGQGKIDEENTTLQTIVSWEL